MFYTIPTKRGLGVELWGTPDDLDLLYYTIAKFWNDANLLNKKGFENRDRLISGFSYEVRKAMEERRMKRPYNHFSEDPAPHFGTKISWVHFLFSVAALRFNMQYKETNESDVSVFAELEYCLEKSMNDFDEAGASLLKPFLYGGIYANNLALYQFMRHINLEYALLGGGKRAFRKLPRLMMKSVYNNPNYEAYMSMLEFDAKRLGCDISELELNDDDFDYDSLKW